MFLFDGVNAVDQTGAREIAQFVDTERNRNNACLTTQVPTEALLRVTPCRELNPLSRDQIKELVNRLIPDPDQLLARFGEAQYAICSVPLQLELLVELWSSTHRVAANLDELFQHALGSVLDRERWKRQGHEDYPELLFELAFRMVVERLPFKPHNHDLPLEIEQVLIDEKWLVPRGDVMEFRHDKVRSYLASRYFTARWNTLLREQEIKVDSNWDSMIEFHLSQEKDSRTAREILLLILAKDVESAKRIFAWLGANRPDLVQGWRDEFSFIFGKRVLE